MSSRSSFVMLPLPPNEKAKLPGPPGKTLTPAKPKWRPRSASAAGSASCCITPMISNKHLWRFEDSVPFQDVFEQHIHLPITWIGHLNVGETLEVCPDRASRGAIVKA